MWPEEGNMSDMTTIGLYKCCGQKRVIKLMWQQRVIQMMLPELSDINDVARRW